MNEGLRSLRQELRAEGMGQLRDVASMFVQQFKASRIAHAEVQTAAEGDAVVASHPLQPPISPFDTTARQRGPGVGGGAAAAAAAAAAAGRGAPEREARYRATEIAVQTSVGAADMEVQTSGDLAGVGLSAGACA